MYNLEILKLNIFWYSYTFTKFQKLTYYKDNLIIRSLEMVSTLAWHSHIIVIKLALTCGSARMTKWKYPRLVYGTTAVNNCSILIT